LFVLVHVCVCTFASTPSSHVSDDDVIVVGGKRKGEGSGDGERRAKRDKKERRDKDGKKDKKSKDRKKDKDRKRDKRKGGADASVSPATGDAANTSASSSSSSAPAAATAEEEDDVRKKLSFGTLTTMARERANEGVTETSVIRAPSVPRREIRRASRTAEDGGADTAGSAKTSTGKGTSKSGSSSSSSSSSSSRGGATKVAPADRNLHETIAPKEKSQTARLLAMAEHVSEREVSELERTCSPDEAYVVSALRRIVTEAFLPRLRTELGVGAGLNASTDSNTSSASAAGPGEEQTANPRNLELRRRVALAEEQLHAFRAEAESWRRVSRGVAAFSASDAAPVQPIASALLASTSDRGAARAVPGIARGAAIAAGTVARAARSIADAAARAEDLYSAAAADFHARSFEGYGEVQDARSIITALIG
jgi:hypothetical protein